MYADVEYRMADDSSDPVAFFYFLKSKFEYENYCDRFCVDFCK